jgi:proline racemase
VGPDPAVATTVAGQAWITGIHQYGLDPTDPFPEGYTLSDTWLKAL